MSGHEALVSAYLASHAENAARLLESLPVEQANAVLGSVDAATAAPVLGHMLPTYAARCIERQSAADGAALIEQLGSQEAVAVLRHLGRSQREDVLNGLGAQWVVAFKLLLSYPVNTVGAWVEPRVLTLPDDVSVAEARDRVARSGAVAHTRIYVLDRGRRIRGAVRGLVLLQMPARRKLAAALEPADALWAREPLATAIEKTVWERNPEAPVMNHDEEFVGAITYPELRKAYRQLTRSGDGGGDHDLAEVTELIAIGAESLWQSLGELVRPDRQR